MQKAVELLTAYEEKKNKGKPLALAENPDQVIPSVLGYLERFGYFPRVLEGWKDITIGDILTAIGVFRTFFGLRESEGAAITSDLLGAMMKPRCGFADCGVTGHMEAIHAWAQDNLAAWRKRGLKYYISSYVGNISKIEQEDIFQKAFDSWCKHGNIDVVRTKTSSSADIIIKTGRGRSWNFDGRSGVLAWAELPNGSDRQLTTAFDLDENWLSQGTSAGINLFIVAAHEWGHLFGLTHSNQRSALMFPTYNPTVPEPQRNDDIPRFQARYGVRESPPPVDPGQPGQPSGNVHVEITSPIPVYVKGTNVQPG